MKNPVPKLPAVRPPALGACIVTAALAAALLSQGCAGAPAAPSAAGQGWLFEAGGLKLSERYAAQIVGVLKGAGDEEAVRRKMERQYRKMREMILLGAAGREKGLETDPEVETRLEEYSFTHLVELYIREKVTLPAQRTVAGEAAVENPRWRLKREKGRLMTPLLEEASRAFEEEIFDEALAAAVAGESTDPVVARVGDREIRYGELLPRISRISHPSDSTETATTIARNVLYRRIQDVRLYQMAREEELDLTEPYLQDVGDFEVTLLSKAYEQKYIFDPLRIGEDEVRDYYLEHREDFRRGEERLVYEIVLQDAGAAERVRVELMGGSDFQELARQHSTVPTGEGGGYVGYVEKGRARPEIDEALWAIAPGEVTPVIRTPRGFHLLTFTEETEGRTPELAEIEEKVRSLMLPLRKEEAREEALERLESEIEVHFNKSLWEKLGERE